MTTVNLNCKLLCASEAAYCIQPDSHPGKYNPCKSDPSITKNIINQYNAVGFIEDPYVCVSSQIEACLVGKTDYGIVVSFRGTLPPAWNLPSIFDWIENIFMAPPVSSPYFTGKVHSGFFLAVKLLESQILAAVHALDPSHRYPLYFTGHSKGGGMVPIAAMYFRNKYSWRITQTIRIAGPKPGDQEFADGFNAVFPADINYQNYLDIVPLLPPSKLFVDTLLLIPDLPESLKHLLKDAASWNYVNVGIDAYINEDGVVTRPPLIEERIGEIMWKLIELDASAIADAHHASCGYRYMQGVCQGNVCKF
ncbi:hypothetical protein A9Q86_02260 [Flavobacteriales bacterium 33_180_T64]|nr:hypothetical protein A9Q86_02260 [Flavobacteriales bacterium 33_180_T64]